ncbi:MAG: class E sortase [Sciscionella sp.]|nr:class E sortase [Sciscionella sp.]
MGPPSRGVGGGDRGRTALRTIGEVLITAGLVVLLFVVYQVYVTDLFSAKKQSVATQAIDKEWANQRGETFDLADGHGIAKMYVPALGADYHFTIVQGTTQDDLAIGPGHYTGSALPGQPGNFAVAGHRVGKGAPFNDIDMIQPCDAIIIETAHNWFIYRMLPTKDEVANWQTHAGDPKCKGVAPLGTATNHPQYQATVGQEIVDPSEGDVISPIPHHPDMKANPGDMASLITLTTCNPKFSDQQRLIVHGVLTQQYQKDPNKPNELPKELTDEVEG